MAFGLVDFDTQNRCMNCADCIAALQKARREAKERAKKGNSKCTCNAGASTSECPIASRCKEPLAWSITPTEIKDQSASMLYTLISREIRDMIFTYALTDTTSFPMDCELGIPKGTRTFRDRYTSVSEWQGIPLYQSDIAFSLLLTCKAVYMETFNLPLSINALPITSLGTQFKKNCFYAWQLAQIARLDIRLPQLSLENGALRNALKEWKPLERSQGCYIVPQEGLLLYGVDRKLDKCPESFNNVLIPATTTGTTDKRPRILTDMLRNAQISETAAQPCSSNLRFSLASRLTHLTLRLASKEWWTWTDDPGSTDPRRTLRLDPSFDSPKHLSDEMRFLAKERRAGRPPKFGAESWGTHITSLLPDLQVLELVLETWEVKSDQLEDVAQCARTWTFDVGENTLVWDGKVVEKRWQRGLSGLRLPKDALWFHRCRDYEVRIVRFVRHRK